MEGEPVCEVEQRERIGLWLQKLGEGRNVLVLGELLPDEIAALASRSRALVLTGLLEVAAGFPDRAFALIVVQHPTPGRLRLLRRLASPAALFLFLGNFAGEALAEHATIVQTPAPELALARPTMAT